MLKEDYKTYLHRIRLDEFNRIFRRVPRNAFVNALEVGAGDTFQSQLLATRVKKLTSTEVNPARFRPKKRKNIKYVICSAEKLPFQDNMFKLIYSSNVFEHIQHRKKALSEMKRVLARDGIMIHIMPNRTWKILNSVLHYPNLVVALLEQAGTQKRKMKKDTSPQKTPEGIWLKRLKLILPQVHGTARNNIHELLEFGKSQWISFFEKNDLTVHKIIKLPLCSGYGFGFDRLRAVGEKMGLGSSFAYIITRKGEKPIMLKYFQKAT